MVHSFSLNRLLFSTGIFGVCTQHCVFTSVYIISKCKCLYLTPFPVCFKLTNPNIWSASQLVSFFKQSQWNWHGLCFHWLLLLNALVLFAFISKAECAHWGECCVYPRPSFGLPHEHRLHDGWVGLCCMLGYFQKTCH